MSSVSCLPTTTIPSCHQALNDPPFWAWHAKGLTEYPLGSSCISGTLHSYCWFYQMAPPLLLASGPCLSFPSESPDWSKCIIVCAQEEINKSLWRKLAFQTAWVQCNTCMHTNTPLFVLSGSVRTKLQHFKNVCFFAARRKKMLNALSHGCWSFCKLKPYES